MAVTEEVLCGGVTVAGLGLGLPCCDVADVSSFFVVSLPLLLPLDPLVPLWSCVVVARGVCCVCSLRSSSALGGKDTTAVFSFCVIVGVG